MAHYKLTFNVEFKYEVTANSQEEAIEKANKLFSEEDLSNTYFDPIIEVV